MILWYRIAIDSRISLGKHPTAVADILDHFVDWIHSARRREVTSIIDEWDHRFLVEEGDPLVEAFEASGDADALVVLDHPPTAEVMALLLEERMLERFPETVSGVSVEVAETSELCATY